MKRNCLKWNKQKIRPYVVCTVLLGLIILFCLWQNNSLMVSVVTYQNSKITQEMDGTRIVQVSDLHSKEFGKGSSRLLQAISTQQPDVTTALEFVRGAVQIAPVYFVTGNHEKFLSDEDTAELQNGLQQYGVVTLQNESVAISVGKSPFYLIGIDDTHLANSTLQTITSQLPHDFLQILLAHEPQFLDRYTVAGVDLVLCGHAHGGQFRLPLINIGFIAPGQGLFPKYTAGQYSGGQTTMIVSRGLGNSVIPVRVFNRPEIVTVVLSKK